jgi:hypothetical protein
MIRSAFCELFRPNAAEKARALVRQHLADGPKPGAQIEAAAEASDAV